MRGRFLLLIFIILFIYKSGYSQDNDFGIWYGVNSEIKLSKKIEIDLSAMLRTFNNASKTEQLFLEGGASYKFNKFLSVASSYRLTYMLEDDNEYHIRHKLLTDLKGTLPVNDFTFSARLRLQMQLRTYIEDEGDEAPSFTGRLRFKCLYNIPKFPVNPYISIETFSPIFERPEKLVGKERITAGVEFKIVKNHSVEAEYIFERDFLPYISDISIVALAYNMKF